MKQTLRTALVVVVVCAIPLALAGALAAGPPEVVWLNAPGWSRARQVGITALDQPTPLAADEAGRAYLLLARTLAAVEPVVRAAVAYWAAINEPGFQIVSAPLDAAVDALRPETRAEYTGEVYLHAASTAGKTFRDDGATTPEGCEAQDEGFA